MIGRGLRRFAIVVSALIFAPNAVFAQGIGSLPPRRDLSPWGMFLAADAVVKAIMIGLVFASVMTWTVWLAKYLELRRSVRDVRVSLRVLESAATVEQAAAAIGDLRQPVARLVHSAALEMDERNLVDPSGLKERVALMLGRIEAAALRRANRGLGVVASIGATAPFVGLFGTVWGIMNSFIGISNAQTTNLAVVAPGIAEALLATALGLLAAIPAVIIYNGFARSIGGYRVLLGDAAVLVMRLVSRNCDEERAAAKLRRAAE